MAKKQQDTQKPRFHYFCHQCQAVFDSNEILHECECGCAWLMVTDRDTLNSGYFVEGVRVE